MNDFDRLILAQLAGGEPKTGRYLREALRDLGRELTLVEFYSQMVRLQNAQWVRGWYRPLALDGQTIQTRLFQITDQGRAAFAALGNSDPCPSV